METLSAVVLTDRLTRPSQLDVLPCCRSFVRSTRVCAGVYCERSNFSGQKVVVDVVSVILHPRTIAGTSLAHASQIFEMVRVSEGFFPISAAH